VSSRARLLAALRATPCPPVDLPVLPAGFTRYDDLEAQLRRALEAAKASVVALAPGADLATTIRQLPVVSTARAAASLSPRVDLGPLPRDAAECAALDVLVFSADFGVAENGALWVPEPSGAPRAALFLAQHVVAIIARDRLVHDMHEAYARLGASFGCYGSFLCGPSKTADIEQALVIGAHGARSMTVVIT
jgi:L-lactate dehydrogenase complex protein LldG